MHRKSCASFVFVGTTCCLLAVIGCGMEGDPQRHNSYPYGNYQAYNAGRNTMCPVAPGSTDYCRLCGPCYEGEGHCFAGQCARDLVCQQSVGRQYDTTGGVSVCVRMGSSGNGGYYGAQGNGGYYGTQGNGGYYGTQGYGGYPGGYPGGSGGYYAPQGYGGYPNTAGGYFGGSSAAAMCAQYPNRTVMCHDKDIWDKDYCKKCGPCFCGEGYCDTDENNQCMPNLVCVPMTGYAGNTNNRDRGICVPLHGGGNPAVNQYQQGGYYSPQGGGSPVRIGGHCEAVCLGIAIKCDLADSRECRMECGDRAQDGDVNCVTVAQGCEASQKCYDLMFDTAP